MLFEFFSIMTVKLPISVEDAYRLQQAMDNVVKIQGIFEVKRVIH